MAVIHVPRPPRDAYNPDREASGLLKAHLAHAHEAERKLPMRYREQIDIYASAVRTEREAAEFLRQVTEAVHQAHDDAAARRKTKKQPNRTRTVEIAAVAEKKSSSRKKASTPKKKGRTSKAKKSATKKSSKARR